MQIKSQCDRGSETQFSYNIWVFLSGKVWLKYNTASNVFAVESFPIASKTLSTLVFINV